MNDGRRRALRLTWVTDGQGDPARILELAAAMIRGGLRTVQVRERTLSAGALVELCQDLWDLMDPVDGVVLVNDRADVAALACHGVHLPVASMTPQLARELVGPERIVGCAVHDERELAAAVAGGADYVMVSPVFPTASKPGVVPLGVDGATRLARRSSVPAIWLGGITVETVRTTAAARPFGIAAMSALTTDPEATVSAFLEATREVAR